MAKYDVTFSCGHKGTVEIFGKSADRENKLKWYEEQGLCPECYKAKKRAEQEKQPLTLNVGLDSFDRSGYPFILFFAGNTMPVKDEIKKLNYRWDELVTGAFGIFQKPEKAWQTRVSAEDIENAINKVKEVFPDIEVKINFTKVDLFTYQDLQNKSNEKTQALNKELATLTAPVKPECYPEGRWNGKIYGSTKYGYSIYVDGDKVTISNDEKEQLESYSSEKAAYNAKVAEIKAKYN